MRVSSPSAHNHVRVKLRVMVRTPASLHEACTLLSIEALSSRHSLSKAIAETELGWSNVLDWLPHEELIGSAWVARKGTARDDEVTYFRGQLKLFAKLVYGRNHTAAGTIVRCP